MLATAVGAAPPAPPVPPPEPPLPPAVPPLPAALPPVPAAEPPAPALVVPPLPLDAIVPAVLLLLPPLPEELPPEGAPDEPLPAVPALLFGVSGVAASLHAKSEEPESPARRSQRACAWNMMPFLFNRLSGGGLV